MRRSLSVAGLLALTLLAGSTAVRAADPQTFTGVISDDMCGLDHTEMAGGEGDKKCTLSCVEGGSSFVLADREHKKIYELDDQKKPKEFAGDKVVITGTLTGEKIHVLTIVAAKP